MSPRDKSPASGPSSSRNPTRRLLKELETWRKEEKNEQGIERLGPVGDEDLFEWEAVINGRDVGFGYDGGRWLLSIQIPANYPLQPPKMRFATPVVHPNIALDSGEICLDLLKEAWTPAYSVLECVRAVRMLLSCPEVDSPLNVDAATMLRNGDAMATKRLVEYWCSDEAGRYTGP
ncbi:ubiquitin-conjugating enzyme/RWD-like protein [Stachybotrys elegans]|uniref:Ubiquitin-conjugating enzyme/RWD-like protein n=1 Tax=Stachybotrys elegans TaxID=80388 RepID=A0A8K0WX30_9HYPO|nr:ubiquitin-conjugating enzyme/RWD-like protein [Stachybotrys elegans]